MVELPSLRLYLEATSGADVESMHMFLYGNLQGAPSGGTLATRAAMTQNMKVGMRNRL